MNYVKKKEEVLVFEKEGELINVLIDVENGMAIAYNKDLLLKFEIDVQNPLKSIKENLKEEKESKVKNKTKNNLIDEIVDTKRTAKSFIKHMMESEVFQIHEFKLSTEELENAMNGYGIVTKELLRKIWDDLMSVYISDELIEDLRTMESRGLLEELIVYQCGEQIEVEIEKGCAMVVEEKYDENIEKIKEMIIKGELVRREYDDDFYYDAYFKMSNFGIEELDDEDENNCVILQIREKLEFAQVVNPDIETKQLTIKEFVETLDHLRKLSKLLEI